MMPNFTFNTTALNQYEQFIAQNPDFADKLDSMGRFVVMLLISGEREMLSEAGYTVLNMLSLYHEIVLSRHRKINTRLYDGTINSQSLCTCNLLFLLTIAATNSEFPN